MQMRNRFRISCVFVILFFFGFLLFPLSAFSQFLSEQRLKFFEEQLAAPSRQIKKDDLIKPVHVEYVGDNFRDPLQPQIFLSQEREAEMKIQVVVEEEQLKASEVLLFSIQGIVSDAKVPLVIMNNTVLKKGDVISIPRKDNIQKMEEVTIMDIEKDGVTVIYGGAAEKLSAPGLARQLHGIQ